jgi:hypothetical protein
VCTLHAKPGALKRGMINMDYPRPKRQKGGPAPNVAVAAVRDGYCLARAFPNKQCGRKQQGGLDLCKLHGKMESLPRGRITEPRNGPGADDQPDASVAERLPEGPEGPGAVDQPDASVAERLPEGPEAVAQPDAEHMLLWNELWGEACKTSDPTPPALEEAKKFAAFTKLFKNEQEALQLPFVATPVGDVGGSERQLMAFLQYQRYHGTIKERCSRKPLALITISNRVGLLRSALADFGLTQHLGTHLKLGDEHPRSLRKKFRQWALED